MEVKLVTNKDRWNAWAREQGASFLQSWEWGDILLAEGKRVERAAFVDDGEVYAQAQIVYQNLPFGWRYAFCPMGPVTRKLEIENWKLGNELVKHLVSKKCIFFRFEPSFLILNSEFLLLHSTDITPRATTFLDLTKTEDELLAAMHAKTRYNIRLAEKKSLEVRVEKKFEVFWRLMQETGKRDEFRLHDKKHYEAIFSSPLSEQLTAYYKDVPIAVGVFVGFNTTYTYLFGASSYEHRNLMAPYLIQWEGIKYAQKLGYARYDFFGIAPRCRSGRATATEESKRLVGLDPLSSASRTQDDSYEYDLSHQYAGVTRFKLGFGGTVRENPGTHDLIISPMRYKMYKFLRKVRRLV